MSTETANEKIIVNAYQDSFLAEWPDSLPARLRFCEDRLGFKREWLLKMLALEDRDTTGVADMPAEEVAQKFEYEVGCWTATCGDCVQWAGWEVDRFAALPECHKKKALSKNCREWIMEKLFQKWTW